MSFLETVGRAKAYLRDHQRVSLRALGLEFRLDDEQLEALIEELVDVQQVGARERKALSWVGPAAAAPALRRAAVAAQRSPESALDAERRQLSVLFCDLVGSTLRAYACRVDASGRTRARSCSPWATRPAAFGPLLSVSQRGDAPRCLRPQSNLCSARRQGGLR